MNNATMKLLLKITGILFLIISVLFIAVLIAGFIFLKNFDVKKYKPRIVQFASQALGRPVDFKDIDLKVSLENGIWFHLTDFSVDESPEFGSGYFVTVEEIDAGVAILPFLMSRRISVPSVSIRSPQINVIRNTGGRFNIQTIGQPSPGLAREGQSVSPAVTLPAVLINSLRIENAGFYFIDRSIQPELKLAVSQLALDVRRFSLSNPFDVLLEAAVLSPQKNIHFSGKVQLKLSNNEARLSQAEVTVDLNHLPLEMLRMCPLLKGVPLPQVLEGRVKVNIKEAAVSDKGLGKVNADVSLISGKVIAAGIVPGVSFEANHVDFGIENLTLDGSVPAKTTLKAALYQDQSNVDFSGMISFDLNNQAVTVKDGIVNMDLNGFPLERFKASGLVPVGIPFPEIIAGEMMVRINDLAVSPQGIDRMKTDIKWQNGKIAINEVAPGIGVAAGKINIDVKNLSFNEAFDVAGSLGYETDDPNIFFDGKMAVDLAAQNIRANRMSVKIDLARIPIERLKITLAPLKDVPLPEILKGQAEINIKDLSAGPQGLIAVTADAVLTEGEVSMKNAAPGVSFAASRINADINNFGLEVPFGFKVRLAYLSSEPNIHAKGTAIYHMEGQSVTLKDTDAQVDLATFSMDSLRASVAALKDIPLPERLKGDLNVAIKRVDAGPKGLSALSGNGLLKTWEVKLKELAVPVRGSDTSFKMTENLFSIDDFQAVLGKGQITAKVAVADYMTRQNMDFFVEMKGINLAEILDQKNAPVKVEGLVFGSIKARGPAADPKLITGDGNFEVKEAKLKDFNVLKAVLDKISFLPNVSSRVGAKLSEKDKQKLKNKDTEIKKIRALCAIANGVAALDPVSVEADEFLFLGKCNAEFDQMYALTGKVKIPTELSAAMGEGIEELKYLYDENSNISLPVHVSGKGSDVPVVAVTQTAIDMGKNAIRSEGKKQLENILNKVLKVDEQPSSSGEQKKEQTVPSQEQKSPGSQIADGIFDKIFKP